MRRLGILGGMGWPSTAASYRALNEGVAARLGGLHSAPVVIWSFDFAAIEEHQSRGDWTSAGELLSDAARRLEAAGAEGVMLCTNTMHICAGDIEHAVDIPLIHIADATARTIRDDGVRRIGLLGTRYTMEQDFYRGRLEAHGIDVLVPDEPDRTVVHDVIFDELVHGRIDEASRRRYRSIVDGLVGRGATGIIAGCTEIELLLGAEDVPCDYYPTTQLHVDAALDWILGAPAPPPPANEPHAATDR